MTRTMSLTVIALSVALLGGAWLTSVALTSDIPVPPPETPVPTTPPPAAQAPAPSERPTPAPALESTRVPPPPSPPSAPPPEPAVAAPPAEPDSEFASEHSPEVDRAWELAFGEKANPLKWRMAARIFSECLAEVPTNQRCRKGLEAVEPLIQRTKSARHPGLYDPAPTPTPEGHTRDTSEE